MSWVMCMSQREAMNSSCIQREYCWDGKAYPKLFIEVRRQERDDGPVIWIACNECRNDASPWFNRTVPFELIGDLSEMLDQLAVLDRKD